MKFAFWIAAAVIAYAYLGYPEWLWLRSRWHKRSVNRAPITPFTSIVLVVRNEARWLPEKLRNLFEVDYPSDNCEIIVVSDGSDDGTNEILRCQGDSRLRAIINPQPRGKAACLNDAIAAARGEVIVFTDVRQKIEPSALSLLIENFADLAVGCASGELMLGDPQFGEHADGVGLYWILEKQIRELESASGSVVGATGAFYAVRRDLLTPVPPETILDDVYIPMSVVRRGFRVIFDSRARAWDIPDLGAEREFTRKVRTLTGNYQLLQLAPWLLTSQNPLRFEFISHKMARLLVPFALTVTLLTSMALHTPIYRLALLLQLAFYAVGLLAMLPIKRGPIARAANAVFAFVMLNAAAAVAFGKFLTGRKAAWS